MELLRRKWIPGACLILFMLFAEPVPLGARVGDAPHFFSIQYVLMALPWLRPLPSWVLLLPAAVCLGVAFLPVRGRGLRWVPLLLTLGGLSFFPLLLLLGLGQEAGPFWSLLFLAFAGLNLWIRSLDYFYGGAIAALLWDMGAGLRGLQMGMSALPEPYHPAVPPLLVVSADMSAILFFAVLWRHRVDLGKRLGWKWLEAVE